MYHSYKKNFLQSFNWNKNILSYVLQGNIYFQNKIFGKAENLNDFEMHLNL